MGLASLVIGCSRLVLGSAVSILCSVDTAVVLSWRSASSISPAGGRKAQTSVQWAHRHRGQGIFQGSIVLEGGKQLGVQVQHGRREFPKVMTFL